MKIGIIGLRDARNRDDGFWRLAKNLSRELAQRGHEISVYHPHAHHDASTWQNVECISLNNQMGSMSIIEQWAYDIKCLQDSSKRDFDILLQLGHTSPGGWLFRKSTHHSVVTCMTGMAWKKTRHYFLKKWLLRYAEKRAVRQSDFLIVDSKATQSYINQQFHEASHYIPCGAQIFDTPDESALSSFNLLPYTYDLVVSHFEPGDKLEVVLEGYCKSKQHRDLVVVGNFDTSYGRKIKSIYNPSRIHYLGSIDDATLLNNIRHYSKLCFHGHALGGSNHHIVEAMAAGALVCAHDNPFNSSILGKCGLYFDNMQEVKNLMNQTSNKSDFVRTLRSSIEKVEHAYSWKKIADGYESFFAGFTSSESIDMEEKPLHVEENIRYEML